MRDAVFRYSLAEIKIGFETLINAYKDGYANMISPRIILRKRVRERVFLQRRSWEAMQCFSTWSEGAVRNQSPQSPWFTRIFNERNQGYISQHSYSPAFSSIPKKFLWTFHIHDLPIPKLSELVMPSNLRSTSAQEQHDIKIKTFQDDILDSVERAFLLRAAPDASGIRRW